MFLVSLLFVSCGGGDYSPKPQAYLRIDMPEHNYWLVDSLCTHPGDTLVFGTDTMIAITGSCKTFPFTFEANTRVELREKDAPKGEEWVDLLYPEWDGVVFLTYKRLSGPDDLRGQTDTSSRLLEKHYQFTSGIDEKLFEDTIRHVYATTWHLRGRNVASTYQFMATDREHHFLRGALFINRAPNNDSLAPVLEYIQADLDHLIETLRWR
jgi:gliding motility-associated lipoprotein GldD